LYLPVQGQGIACPIPLIPCTNLAVGSLYAQTQAFLRTSAIAPGMPETCGCARSDWEPVIL